MRELTVVEGGRVPYRRALAAQRRLGRARADGEREGDLLLLLEHDPVVTLGRAARPEHLLAGPEGLARQGIECVEIERGGDVTYHGPGQLVGYPILDLARLRRDLHWYVRRLEAALVDAAGRLGVRAFRVEGHTGVWVGEREGDVPAEEAPALVASGSIRKLASIGVHVRRWITWHGFALNVTPEPLERFRLVVPCGIERVQMTSLVSEGAVLEGAADPRLLEAVVEGFCAAFGHRPRRGAPEVVFLQEATVA